MTAGADDAAGGGGMTFGVNLGREASWPSVRTAARAAEDAGLDVVTSADHLGAIAPFSVLAAAAAVTSRIRLRTYVLNAYFWNAALLAREVATIDGLSGGRFEFGLGAGHMKAEHDDAGLPFPPHAERVRFVEEMLVEVRRRLGTGDHVPPPVQQPVPLVVGGWGMRTLAVAARHADVVALSGLLQVPGAAPGSFRMASAAETDERVAVLADLLRRERAAGAAAPVLDALLQQVVVDRPPETAARAFAESTGGAVSVDELLDSPFVLYAETPGEAAAELARRRERYGITSWCTHPASATALADVAAAVRGQPV